MAQFSDVSGASSPSQLGKQSVIVHCFHITSVITTKQTLMIKGCQQLAAFLKGAQTLQAHGIEPLENVSFFAVLWSTAMLLDKTLNFLKTSNNPLFAG